MKKFKPLYYYVALTNLMFFLGNSFYILFPIFLKQLGAPEAHIGIMNNVDKILIIITSVSIASFIRVKNKIIVLRTGYLLMTIAFISYIFISAFSWNILIIRILHGIAFSISMIFGTNIVFDIVPMKDAAEAIGIYGITGAITNAISPFAGELLLSKGYPFYYIFAISAVLVFLSLCVTFIMPKPEPHPDKSSTETRAGFLHLFRSFRFIIITVAAVIFGGCFGVIVTYLPNFVLSTTNFQFSYFFIFYIAVLIIIRFKIIGKLSGYNINRILITMFFTGALLNALLNFLYSLPILIGIGIMYGLTHGILFPIINTTMISLVNTNEKNTANALYMASFYGGMMLFSLPLGFLIDYTGTYLAAFNSCAIAFLIGIILLSFNALKYGAIRITREAPVAVE
ncbi:MAG: MFS transporter [Spirochaetes bacterium]|nr:MFS transporter [Spirochaetota bacterium]